MTFVIEGRKLGTYYEQNHILRGVSIAIRPGETIGSMGRNDMAETPLICTLSGWTCTLRGRVLIDGRDMTRADVCHRSVRHCLRDRKAQPNPS